MAAGMTLPAVNLEAFRQKLNDDCPLNDEDFIPVVDIDVPMPIGYITEQLIEEFKLLEPTGKGNPAPLFAENYFNVRSVRPIGKERKFFRLSVMNSSGSVMDALYFNDGELFEQDLRRHFGDEAWDKALAGRQNPIELMLAYYPGVNEYQGTRSLQIIVSHYSFINR
jgi:single-stranded-DNA-specific exonuclease